MTNELWLRCDICPGQFSGEFSVSGDTSDGEGFSLFISEEHVDLEQQPNEAFTRVEGWLRVVELDRSGESVLVRLPRQAIENGQTITVRGSELKLKPIRQEV